MASTCKTLSNIVIGIIILKYKFFSIFIKSLVIKKNLSILHFDKNLFKNLSLEVGRNLSLE